jgi:hypothetical protein
MSARPVALLLLGFSLLVAIPNASAATNPIPDVDVVVRRKPPKGFPTINAETNDQGVIELPRLQPGDYELVIDAKSLLTATTASDHAPTPQDNPITAINISLPSNPDTVKYPPVVKQITAEEAAAGVAIPFTVPKGQSGIRIQIGQHMQSLTAVQPVATPALPSANGVVIITTKTGKPANAITPAQPPPPPAPRIGGVYVAAGDINGDGKPDLASGQGQVITNPCRPPYLCLNAVDLVVKDSKGKIVGHGKTDAAGIASIQLTQNPGYLLTLDVDGKSLVAVMDKLYPQTVPVKKKSGGSSFSLGLGVGGFGGGGGSTRSTTTTTQGGATGAGKPDVNPSQTTSSTSSGGGGGVGLTIPVTLHGKSKSETATPTTGAPPPPPSILIAILLPVMQQAFRGNRPVLDEDVSSTTSEANSDKIKPFTIKGNDQQADATYTGPTTVNAGTITKVGTGTLTLSPPNSLTTTGNSTVRTPYSRDTAVKGLSVPLPSAKIGDGPLMVRLSTVNPADIETVKTAAPDNIAQNASKPSDTKVSPGPRTNGGVIGFIDGHAAPVSPNSSAVSNQTPTVATGYTTQRNNISWDFGDGQNPTGLSNVHALVKNGAGAVILNGLTDANGSIPLKDLKPGTYTIEIDGPSYAASFEKTFFDHQRRSSGTPTPDTPHGLISAINITLPANPDATTANSPDHPARKLFSAETPYCPGTAAAGMRFTFTISPGTTTSAGPQAYVEAKYQFLAGLLILTGW